MFHLLLCLLPLYSSQLTPNTTSDERNGFLPANESFVFDVDCGPVTNATCNAIKEDLATVGNLIANELYFAVPVCVCVDLVNEYFSEMDSGSIIPSEIATITWETMSCKLY